MSGFAGSTDPTPYITMAYLIGFGTLGGFTAWIFIQRRKLRMLIAALEQEPFDKGQRQ